MQTATWMTLLTLNGLWFAAGAYQFGFRSAKSAKALVARDQRTSWAFMTLGFSIRFLGGLNFALLAFCSLLWLFPELFQDPRQIALFASFLAVAHGSQVVVNLSMIVPHRTRVPGAWAVLSGPMLFIFFMDCVLMLTDSLVAVWTLISI